MFTPEGDGHRRVVKFSHECGKGRGVFGGESMKLNLGRKGEGFPDL